MMCIDCGAKTKVFDSVTDEDITFRRRKCPMCGMVVFTVEDLLPTDMDDRFTKAFAKKNKGRKEKHD